MTAHGSRTRREESGSSGLRGALAPRLAQQQAVTDAAGADGQGEVAAEEHQLFENHDAGEDDVRALRLEAGHPSPPRQREALEPLTDRGHVRLLEREPVPRLS